ncbi:MAG: hypothetical protein P1U63_13315 [Coxiellaceae bacterium]|nr:hypothetical protein [Coxiellaceae bacterium]
MQLVLMEAGTETIVVNCESGEYFFLDSLVWQQLHLESIDQSHWQRGHAFTLPALGETYRDNMAKPPADIEVGQQIMPKELLQKFIDPEKNPGAMIALRDSDQAALKIFDKRRYKKLVGSFSEQE